MLFRGLMALILKDTHIQRVIDLIGGMRGNCPSHCSSTSELPTSWLAFGSWLTRAGLKSHLGLDHAFFWRLHSFTSRSLRALNQEMLLGSSLFLFGVCRGRLHMDQIPRSHVALFTRIRQHISHFVWIRAHGEKNTF